MDKIFEKFSSYNIMTNLIPGGIFTFLLEYFVGIQLLSGNIIESIVVYYFVGMVLNRVGSLFLEPILLGLHILKVSDTDDFVAAEKEDEKILTYLEVTNMFRTMAAGFLVIVGLDIGFFLPKLLRAMSEDLPVVIPLRTWILFFVPVILFVLFVFAFRKQNEAINARVHIATLRLAQKKIEDIQREETSIPYYMVNTFSDGNVGGDPTGVCILKKWLPDELLQQIATQNHLFETAFAVKYTHPTSDRSIVYDLRWFSPHAEEYLSGNGALACADILFRFIETTADEIAFRTKNGCIKTTKKDKAIWMELPVQPVAPQEKNPDLARALGIAEDYEIYVSEDIMIVLPGEKSLRACKPDTTVLAKVLDTIYGQKEGRGIILTAPATAPKDQAPHLHGINDPHFLIRNLTPNHRYDETPILGRTYSLLIPYWAKRLGMSQMTAQQISTQNSLLLCEYTEDRVQIGGTSFLYMMGEIKRGDI